ncbi:hypothetical protein [Streptomyces sp. 8K308]|uniref:hypothetical protein n=1 Tax=Streptomyces sp. 8K308 TaxID=2530388 RepID=UPI001A9CCEE8|nr:hypothetical protein [Streptomyces sp. 8K308]
MNQIVTHGPDTVSPFPGDRYSNMFNDVPASEQRELAEVMLQDIRGASDATQENGRRDYLRVLGAVEQNRSVSDLVYRAMAYEMGAQGGQRQANGKRKGETISTLSEALKRLPMAPGGAQSGARRLNLFYKFYELIRQGMKPQDLARAMNYEGGKVGLTAADLEKMSGRGRRRILRKDFWTRIAQEPDRVTVEEYQRVMRRANPRRGDDFTEEEKRDARERVNAWEGPYSNYVWGEVAGRGEITPGGVKMADDEMSYLEVWANTMVGEDFGAVQDKEKRKQALFDHIERRVYSLYGMTPGAAE